MAVRIRYKITAYVSSTTAEEKDLANQTWEVMTDTQGEGGSWKSTVAPGDTDVPVNLGNLAIAKCLIIRTTSKDPTQVPVALTFKRGTTSGEPFIVAPLGDAKEGHYLTSTSSLTALFVSNTGTVPMEMVVIAVGD